MNSKLSKFIPTRSVLTRYSTLLALSMITTLIVVSGVIALPYTEKVSDQFQYDLNLKENQYRARSYLVEFDLEGEDQSVVNQKIERSKDVLMRRLDRFGVESAKISDAEAPETDVQEIVEEEAEESEELNTDEIPVETTGLEDEIADNEERSLRYIEISVDTTKDLDLISQIIRSRTFVRIVTPKEDAVFDDPEDQIAQYLPENYDSTRFTRYSFRNVAIKELPTSTGDTAYFGVYKVNFGDRGDFYDLLDRYAGQSIGIQIDGFVTPYQVPADFAKNSQQARTYNPDFAPAVGQTETEALVGDILFNSGVIPVKYTVYSETDMASEVVKPDYPTAFLAVFAGILATLFFIGYRNRKQQEETIVFLLSVHTSMSLWVALMKFFYIPVDLGVLILTSFILIFLTKLFTYRRIGEYELYLLVLVASLIFARLTGGFESILATTAIEVAVISILSVTMVRFYTVNIRRYLLK